MVDPYNITKYDRNDWDLEEFAVFAVCVAGKPARVIASRVSILLARLAVQRLPGLSPLELIATFDATELAEELRLAGIGCYNQKATGLRELSLRIDVRTCTVAQLEAIPYIGPKTARFFLMHSRQGVRVAALDRHILKHLAEHVARVPKNSPPKGRTYNRLEEQFLALADKAGMTAADYDLMVWKRFAK